MPVNPLVKQLALSEEELESQVLEAMKGLGDEEVEEAYEQSVCSFEQDKIIQGKIVNIIGDSAIIDVGYKSEGAVPLEQFDNASELSVGDEVEVLLDRHALLKAAGADVHSTANFSGVDGLLE